MLPHPIHINWYQRPLPRHRRPRPASTPILLDLILAQFITLNKHLDAREQRIACEEHAFSIVSGPLVSPTSATPTSTTVTPPAKAQAATTPVVSSPAASATPTLMPVASTSSAAIPAPPTTLASAAPPPLRASPQSPRMSYQQPLYLHH